MATVAGALAKEARVTALAQSLVNADPKPNRPKPPYRADHVGSLLRPAPLTWAREKAEAGALTASELQRIEDVAIGDAVALQQESGLVVVTDGEFRRAYFHLDFLTSIEGVETVQDPAVAHFHKADGSVLEFSPPRMKVTGRLHRRAPILRRDFEVLDQASGPNLMPKITVPSPSMGLRGGRAGVDAEAYPDLADFHADLARVYREEIADLYEAGCRYLQLDDTNLAYLCDPARREAIFGSGQDPDSETALSARLINQSLAEAPEDLFKAIHLCRGNFKSAFVAEGGYEPVAELLFNGIDVDAFLLEFDDDRSGSFEPLRFLPKGKLAVLGLVSSKQGQLESKDEIKRRVEEASRFVPLEQLCLSPQCGFASTCHGNDISFDDQRRKLELVVECAEEIWGRA
jgi:5-methyltetrahydropteroyltriglutamate--homocysteine methyltransferase